MKNKGWRKEHARHSLASKGVKTKGSRDSRKKIGKIVSWADLGFKDDKSKFWVPTLCKSYEWPGGAEDSDGYIDELEVLVWEAGDGKVYAGVYDNMNEDIGFVKDLGTRFKTVGEEEIREYIKWFKQIVPKSGWLSWEEEIDFKELMSYVPTPTVYLPDEFADMFGDVSNLRYPKLRKGVEILGDYGVR